MVYKNTQRNNFNENQQVKNTLLIKATYQLKN